MRYLKLVFAGILVLITLFQSLIYGFLDFMLVWLLYCLVYLAVGLFQTLHVPSAGLRIFSLIYISAPLAALIVYAVKSGLPRLTQTFYIVFMIALALSVLWEIVSLCLAVKDKSDNEKPGH